MTGTEGNFRTSRRDFIRAGAAGLAATTIPTVACSRASNTASAGQPQGLRSATPEDLQGLVGDGRRRRILLRGGVVFSLNPRVGDFEKADVLIDGTTIAEIAPTVAAAMPRSSTAPARSSCQASSRRTIISTKPCSAARSPMGCSRARGRRRATGRSFNIWTAGASPIRPVRRRSLNNVPGTIVTMMNPRHVRDVLIAGKVVYWKGKLVGWNVDALLRQIEQARDRVLARINGTAKVGRIPSGNNSLANPYRPNFLGGCCEKGQNTTAPAYVLRP
jgi:hypothetical protein